MKLSSTELFYFEVFLKINFLFVLFWINWNSSLACANDGITKEIVLNGSEMMKEKVYFTIYLFVDFLVESDKARLLDFMSVFYLSNLFL